MWLMSGHVTETTPDQARRVVVAGRAKPEEVPMLTEVIPATACLIAGIAVVVYWWPRRRRFRFPWPLIVAVLLCLPGFFLMPATL